MTAQVVHEGHFSSLVEAELSRAGYADPIMRISGWRTRRVPVAAAGRQAAAAVAPAKGTKVKAPKAWAEGFAQAMRWRVIEGSIGGSGRTTAWARPLVNRVDNEPVSGIALVALLAATTSTLSALADATDTVVVSTDLDLHALREPVGSSIWITTESFPRHRRRGRGHVHAGRQGRFARGGQPVPVPRRALRDRQRPPMITETAYMTVEAGFEGGFEAAISKARILVEETPGCRYLTVQRGVERPSVYLVTIGWDTIEDHLVGFRESDRFPLWREILGPHLQGPPLVEHWADLEPR